MLHDYAQSVGIFTIGALVSLFAIFFILALYQIWRAAQGITKLTETLNRELPDILIDVHDVVVEFRETVRIAHGEVETISALIGRVREIGNTVGLVQQLAVSRIRQPVFVMIKTMLAVMRGLQVFANVYRGTAKPRR
jgi:hypothetical protein